MAFDDAKSVPDKFVDGFEESLSDVRTAVNSIEQAAEILAYNSAMTAREVGKKHLEDLDPHRLVLTLEEDTKKGRNDIVQEVLKIGGNILDIQEVKFSGSLRH